MKPSKLNTSCLHVGLGMFFTAFTLSRSGLRPSWVITCPMNLTCCFFRFIFLLFSLRLNFLALSNSFLRFSSWLASDSSWMSPYPATRISSLRISTPPKPDSCSWSLRSNSSGARLIPNGILRYLYLPKGVQKVVFLLLASSARSDGSRL